MTKISALARRVGRHGLTISLIQDELRAIQRDLDEISSRVFGGATPKTPAGIGSHQSQAVRPDPNPR